MEKREKREKVNILFVCTGNTCRSPMASQIFDDFIKRKGYSAIANIASAGLYADNDVPMTDEASKTLADLNITPHPHKSVRLTIDLIQNSDIIVCMTTEHRDALVAMPVYKFAQSDGATRIFGSVVELTGEEVPDPFGSGLDAYRMTAVSLMKMCQPLLD